MKTLLSLLFLAIPAVTMAQSSRPARLHFVTNYGFFVRNGVETGIPDLVPATDLKLKLVAPSTCYKFPSEVLVQVVNEDNQIVSSEIVRVPITKVITIPVSAMQGGDVYISAEWSKPESFGEKDYQLAMGDEFDDPKLNIKNWRRGTHDNNSAWNRYVNSTSDKVVFIKDGELVNRCIPCAPEDLEKNENRPWMSGTVDSKGKYSFQYGRVDVRAITNPFTGSFPAIWLLPVDQTAGWPYYGEIDIWEMIDAQNTAYGTVHAAKQSQFGGNTPCNYDGLYHVYTFEWTADKMTWSIDGKTAYSTYKKSSLTQSQLDSGYWPFDKKFYLILNQSVGMNTWAKNPVEGHEYETRFDFVRVYQTEEQNPKVGIDDVVVTPASSASATFDLQGRTVSAYAPGLYIVNGKKVIR